LLRATCKPHQEMTRDFERTIVRELFPDVREVYRFKRKEPPPDPMPFRSGPDPKAPIIHHVAQKDAPRFLGLVVSEPAGIISGRPRGARFDTKSYMKVLIDDSERKQIRKSQGLPAQFHRTFDLALFARFLAKIAIGLAVYTIGLDSFDPTAIRRIMTGEDPLWSYLIGGTLGELVVLEPLATHVGHRTCVFELDIEEVPHVAVQIQLFGDLGTPIYTVIAGKLNQTGTEKFGAHDQVLYA
jgi:hypothetical protein